jgi:hypothetical protein
MRLVEWGRSLFVFGAIAVQNKIATHPEASVIPAKAEIWNKTNLDSLLRG